MVSDCVGLMLLVDETGAPFEVEDLDAEGVLGAARMAERQVRRAELARLELAAQWCVLHPPTPDSGYAAWSDDRVADLAGPETLGGEGTPGVAAFTPEPLAAALGISTHAAMALLGDVLDLQHRLPRLWAGVQDLAVPAWKARRVATATRGLPLAAARWVDTALAGRLDRIGPVTIDRLVAAAVAEFDLDQHRQREQAERERWGVRLDHGSPLEGFAATSTLQITGDSVDLQRFHDLVCDHAETLGRLGDPEPWQIRQAKAIGIIATTPTTLDKLLPTTATATAAAASADPTSGVASVTKRRTSVLYLHYTPERWTTETATNDGRPGWAGRPPRGSARSPWPGSPNGSRTPTSASNPSWTWPAPTASTPTTHPPGWPNWSDSATPTASSPTATDPPAAATWTTSTPTTPPDHPAKPPQSDWPPSAADTTAPKPTDDGPTNASATAPTTGTHPTAPPTPSSPKAPSHSDNREPSRWGSLAAPASSRTIGYGCSEWSAKGSQMSDAQDADGP